MKIPAGIGISIAGEDILCTRTIIIMYLLQTVTKSMEAVSTPKI